MSTTRFSEPDEALTLLLSRIDDLCDRAARGEVAISPFLTPREARYVTRRLSPRLSGGLAVLWGGFAEAERVRAFLLPDYCEGMVDPDALRFDPVAALVAGGLEDAAETIREATLPVSVQGSGYRDLTHRDYLGSLLALGVERDTVGDILLPDAHSAVILTGTGMADFFQTHLERVATDAVRVSRLPADTPLAATRRLQPISDTVASPRLDCVVAALCNLSREKAQTAVRAGLCELDYEPVSDCDILLEAPCILSVRGYGKFAVRAFDGVTKKGRVRLVAGKYL